MYFNVKYIIPVTIISCQCLLVYSFSSMEIPVGDEHDVYTPDYYDCLLWMHRNDTAVRPDVLEPTGKHEIILPDRLGYLNIKHEKKVILSCKPRKFRLPKLAKFKEINMRCEKTVLVHEKIPYFFHDLKCDGPRF